MKLSGAGALGASHFGFDALDRVLYSDLSDELLEAAAEGAREEALLPTEGEGVKSLWRSILDMRSSAWEA
jgi:hypothetical protein